MTKESKRFVDTQRALRLFEEIAYVTHEGTVLPMDICPNPLTMINGEAKIRQLEHLLPRLSEVICLAQASSNESSLAKLLEVDLGCPESNQFHQLLLSQAQVPLFVRFDGASLSSKNGEDKLFQAVEFQFRIGGLGFHTAIDEEVLGQSNLPGQYSKTLQEICKETWGEDVPRVVLMAPAEKMKEVIFWANKLKSRGVDVSVISLTNNIQSLEELVKLVQKGARVIVRRELNLPTLLAAGETGKFLIRLALENQVRFEPPLPLLFDGKALSVILSRLDSIDKEVSDLSVPTTPILDEGTAKECINAKRGVLKFGSGRDLPRSFGGRGVFFLEKLSIKQREDLEHTIVNDLKRGFFWIWQPDVGGEKVTAQVLNHFGEQREETGRIRSMIFTDLFHGKVISGGFNLTSSTRVVRGGHPIGTLAIK